MAFLESRCIRTALSPSVLDCCNSFSCGNEDLDAFFVNDAVRYGQQLMGKTYAFVDTLSLKDIVCAFTVSNASIFTNHLPNARKKSIGRNLPWEKRDLIYPAVLIGRLGVDIQFANNGIGTELMQILKFWFVEPDNKAAVRYLAVDALNNSRTLNYYEKNGFAYLFKDEEQEAVSSRMKQPLKTRYMYFDLIEVIRK